MEKFLEILNNIWFEIVINFFVTMMVNDIRFFIAFIIWYIITSVIVLAALHRSDKRKKAENNERNITTDHNFTESVQRECEEKFACYSTGLVPLKNNLDTEINVADTGLGNNIIHTSELCDKEKLRKSIYMDSKVTYVAVNENALNQGEVRFIKDDRKIIRIHISMYFINEVHKKQKVIVSYKNYKKSKNKWKYISKNSNAEPIYLSGELFDGYNRTIVSNSITSDLFPGEYKLSLFVNGKQFYKTYFTVV